MLFLGDPVAFRLPPHRRRQPRNWFSTASQVWRNISSRLAHFWLERSWALLAILTTQIRPGESIQMIENENKKSLNDFFDLETLKGKGLNAGSSKSFKVLTIFRENGLSYFIRLLLLLFKIASINFGLVICITCLSVCIITFLQRKDVKNIIHQEDQ